jgi:hypothetical protein
MTCWRRLRDWQRTGVWDLIHFVLLEISEGASLPNDTLQARAFRASPASVVMRRLLVVVKIETVSVDVLDGELP